jgi:uncharacterized protein (DUF885 family)
VIDRRAFLASSAALASCASAPPASPAQDAALRALVERLDAATPFERSAALSAFDATRLTAQDRILYQSILIPIHADAALARMPYGEEARPYAVTHRAGAYRRIASELGGDGQPLASDLDAETARLESDAARGVAAPDFILDRTLAAVEAARAPLMLARGPAAAAIGEALSRQTEALQRLRANARGEAGVGALPQGAAFYRNALAFHSGLPSGARAAFEDAHRVCASLREEALRLCAEHGLDLSGGLGAALRRAAADEKHLYSDDDAGKARAIADMNTTLARIRTLLPQAFDGLEHTPAELRRLTAEEEARGAQGRREGSTYVVDFTRIRTRPAWTLPSVVAHETLPGHLLQAPLQAAAAPPRLQVRCAGAYGEGWAIYAETLADEMSLFADDHLARLGYLQWMLFRYGRVLVDAGLHSQGWSRAEAVETLRSLQGFDVAFVSIEDDVDRICVEPAVFAAQGLAALHIRDAREAARRRAGERFDLRRFHDAVLRHGPLSPSGIDAALRAAFG